MVGGPTKSITTRVEYHEERTTTRTKATRPLAIKQTISQPEYRPHSKQLTITEMSGSADDIDTYKKRQTVLDTLDSLIDNVNRTTEVLKRGSQEPPEVDEKIQQEQRAWLMSHRPPPETPEPVSSTEPESDVEQRLSALGRAEACLSQSLYAARSSTGDRHQRIIQESTPSTTPRSYQREMYTSETSQRALPVQIPKEAQYQREIYSETSQRAPAAQIPKETQYQREIYTETSQRAPAAQIPKETQYLMQASSVTETSKETKKREFVPPPHARTSPLPGSVKVLPESPSPTKVMRKPIFAETEGVGPWRQSRIYSSTTMESRASKTGSGEWSSDYHSESPFPTYDSRKSHQYYERDQTPIRTPSPYVRPESARSRTISISRPKSPPPRICAACGENIEGPCITALAPSSEYAQRYHPHHFVCTYCLKPLNLNGTYKEHEKKPYCHECFYRLFMGPGIVLGL